MRRVLLTIIWLAIASLCQAAALTIEDCVEKAYDNYPLIKKFDLIRLTSEIELSDINKGWLPRVQVYGQVTAQNVVPSFPTALSAMMQQSGRSIPGMGRVQYKVGIDLSQTIWDGGVSAVRREMARRTEQTREAALETELYSIRERVENIFFAILLTREQIAQNRTMEQQLEANLRRMRSMLRNGVVMQADVDMVEAQLLTLRQSLSEGETALDGYRGVLEMFTGESLANDELAMPQASLPAISESDRPELRLFETRLAANLLADRLTRATLMPRVGLFAQAYYGYPGFDYFRSMMSRDMSFNAMAGIKLSWTIDAFYTKKNSNCRTSLAALEIEAERETFLFNNRLQTQAQWPAIDGLRQVIADDEKIVELRSHVRKAAESQLENGVIDTTALLQKITDENVARLAARFHEIRLLQEIYKLKYTLNR